METATVSDDLRISVPPGASESLGLVPGQEVRVIVQGGRIELIPVLPMSRLRGFLAGIDTTVIREGDRR